MTDSTAILQQATYDTANFTNSSIFELYNTTTPDKIDLDTASTTEIVDSSSQSVCLPIEPRKENLANTPWLSTSLILLLLCTLYLIGKHKKAYIFSLRNLFSGITRSVSYDDETKTTFSSSLLWACNIASFTIFITISSLSYDNAIEALRMPSTILIFATITAGFVLLKYIGFITVGYIFKLRKSIIIYAENYFTVVGTLGLLLIPVTIALIYTPSPLKDVVIYIGYALITVSLAIIVFKNIQIFFSKLSSLFYIFLYLCALEILPILLLIKIVNEVG